MSQKFNLQVPGFDQEVIDKAKVRAEKLGFTSFNDFVRFLIYNFSQGKVLIDLNLEEGTENTYKKLKPVREEFLQNDVPYQTLEKEGAVIVPDSLYAQNYSTVLASTKSYVNEMYAGEVTETPESLFPMTWLRLTEWKNHRRTVRHSCDLFGLGLVPNENVFITSYKQQGYDAAVYALAYPHLHITSTELTTLGVEQTSELLQNKLGISNVRTIKDDGLNALSSMENNSIGGIIGNWTTFISPSPISKLKLIYHKLAPNGVLVLTESAGSSYKSDMYDAEGKVLLWETRKNKYVLKCYFQDLAHTLEEIGFQIIATTRDFADTHDTVIAIKTKYDVEKKEIKELLKHSYDQLHTVREKLKKQLL